MLPTDHRWIYYYDFNLKSYPEEAPSFDLTAVLKRIEQVWKEDKAVIKYENDTLTMRVKDMYFGADDICVLINIANTNATDPAFSNTLTGAVRTEVKKKHEGIGVSCHVLFQKTEIKKHHYLALIEEVVGVPKTRIEQFMTGLFREHCKQEFSNAVTTKGKSKICRPMAEFSGHGSESLKSSLATGVLQGVVLVNHKDTGYIDDEKTLRKTENVMRIRATDAPSGNVALDVIKRAKSYAKNHEFDEVRVQYRETVASTTTTDKDGVVKPKNTTKVRTVKFDSKEENLADLIFTKSELIKLGTIIGQCEEHIHTDLKNQMLKKLEGLPK